MKNTEEKIREEMLEFDPFGGGRADRYDLPVSAIAKQITKYQSFRSGSAKYKISTVENSDKFKVIDFLNEHGFPFIELELDVKKLLQKKTENTLREFFARSRGRDAAFLFGLERLADGKKTKSKTTFLQMLISQANMYFDETKTIFLLSSEDFLQDIKLDDDGWLAGRISVFKSY